MDAGSLRALIEHEIAELRAAYPRISKCRAKTETLNGSISVGLDIRLPEHQSLVSGPLRDDPYVAVRAAFEAARRSLDRTPWAQI